MRNPPSRIAGLLGLSRLPASPATSAKQAAARGPGTENPVIDYLSDLLEDTRAELSRVDSKAALLLASVGVAAGALFVGLLDGKWTPFSLDNRVEWVWWLGISAAAGGVLSIAAAVYPRMATRATPHVGAPAYYGDVAAYKDIHTFRRAIEHAPNIQDRLVDQTFQVSRMVQRKYALLRRGLRLLLFSIAACTSALIINIPLGR